MNLKINVKNEVEITKILDSIELRCSERKMNYFRILMNIENIESRLMELKVNKKDQVGMIFRFTDHCKRFPNRYKGIPAATWIIITRFKSGWFVTDMERHSCNCHPSYNMQFLNEERYQRLFKF
jgi:hypothetical protein